MRLTKEQIDRLFEFTKQHYVEWYDLQIELVDHLANAIEDRCTREPGLSFEDALHASFKEFGVFGFMDVIEKRQRAMSKKYNRLVWAHMKSFFKIPRIMACAGLLAGIYVILSTLRYSEIVFSGVFLILMVSIFVMQYRSIRKQNKKKDPTVKRWLFNEIIQGYGNMTVILLLPFQIVLNLNLFSENMFHHNLITLGASVFLTVYLIMSYVVIRVIPARAAEYLNQTYPGYKMQNGEV